MTGHYGVLQSSIDQHVQHVLCVHYQYVVFASVWQPENPAVTKGDSHMQLLHKQCTGMSAWLQTVLQPRNGMTFESKLR